MAFRFEVGQFLKILSHQLRLLQDSTVSPGERPAQDTHNPAPEKNLDDAFFFIPQQ
jgi:hypothetical protein